MACAHHHHHHHDCCERDVPHALGLRHDDRDDIYCEVLCCGAVDNRHCPQGKNGCLPMALDELHVEVGHYHVAEDPHGEVVN